MNLNQKSWQRCQQLLAAAESMKVSSQQTENGSQLIDCGVSSPGGLLAGIALAEICLANLATVTLEPADPQLWNGQAVTVATDEPVWACMASQYAGWKISVGDYFAMGSGPMRAAWAGEDLFKELDYQEQPTDVVGVLESHQLPTAEVCDQLAQDCRVEPSGLTLLVAPTAGSGTAPLPPVAPDDLTGIGWTNDAVLYGAKVTVWVRGDDQMLAELGSQIPSSASSDFGRPFQQIFESYDRDFYKIDPHLFSPASVQLVNVETDVCHEFGVVCPEVLQQSFGPG